MDNHEDSAPPTPPLEGIGGALGPGQVLTRIQDIRPMRGLCRNNEGVEVFRTICYKAFTSSLFSLVADNDTPGAGTPVKVYRLRAFR